MPRSIGWRACWKPAKTGSTLRVAWCAWRSKTSDWPIRNALAVTLAARDAFDFLGIPEGDLALAQAVVYLAVAPKSNALYTAYGAVQEDVERTAQQPVPLHLRNAPTGLMKSLGYGKGYQYAHDLESKVADMQCLPDNLKDRVYYHPTDEGVEKRIKARLEELKQTKRKKLGHHGGHGAHRGKSPLKFIEFLLVSRGHFTKNKRTRILLRGLRVLCGERLYCLLMCSFRMHLSIITKMPARRAFSAAS